MPKSNLPPTVHEELVLEQMDNLAVECEERTNPEDIYDRFVKAYELYRDLHRKPQTAGEKVIYRELAGQFEDCLRGWGFESAAYKMIPQYRQAANGPFLRFGFNVGNSPYNSDSMSMMNTGAPSATITHPVLDEDVMGVGPTVALSMLAAILRAHVRWHDFWQTGYFDNDNGE